MARKILVFGNPLVKEDSLALEIAKELKIKGVDFIECHAPEQVMESCSGSLVILDVAKGISRVAVLSGAGAVKRQPGTFSLHDLDLAYFLKLAESSGALKDLKIIAIPCSGDKEEIKKQVRSAVKGLFGL